MRALFLGFYMVFCDFLPLLFILFIYSADSSTISSQKETKFIESKKNMRIFFKKLFEGLRETNNENSTDNLGEKPN